MNTRVLEHFQRHVFHIKRSCVELNFIKKPVRVFQNIRLCLKHFRLLSVMPEFLRLVEMFMLCLIANSYWSNYEIPLRKVMFLKE